jgi:hypothetical protein
MDLIRRLQGGNLRLRISTKDEEYRQGWLGAQPSLILQINENKILLWHENGNIVFLSDNLSPQEKNKVLVFVYQADEIIYRYSALRVTLI